MRKTALIVSWLCFALSLTTCKTVIAAGDTLMLQPDHNISLIITGKKLQEIEKWQRIDTVISMLAADVAQFELQNGKMDSREVHYFIHPSGKRRLKAESADFAAAEINVEEEIQSMELGLPAYRFVIHDIAASLKIYLYVSSPELLQTMKDIPLNSAIQLIRNDSRELRKYSRIDIAWKDSSSTWEIVNKSRNEIDQLEFQTLFGVGLIGSKWCPLTQFQLSLVFTDKYGAPFIRAGFNAAYYSLTDFAGEPPVKYSYMSAYKGSFMFNTSESKKPHWIGLELGVTASDNSRLNNRFTMSLTSLIHDNFKLSLDVFRFNNKSSLSGFSVMYSF